MPAHYVARAYETRERDGFVWGRATRGVDAGEPADAASPPSRCTQRFAGSATVAVACDEYVAALLVVSFFSMPWAEKLAESELFKTTCIVGEDGQYIPIERIERARAAARDGRCSTSRRP